MSEPINFRLFQNLFRVATAGSALLGAYGMMTSNADYMLGGILGTTVNLLGAYFSGEVIQRDEKISQLKLEVEDKATLETKLKFVDLFSQVAKDNKYSDFELNSYTDERVYAVYAVAENPLDTIYLEGIMEGSNLKEAKVFAALLSDTGIFDWDKLDEGELFIEPLKDDHLCRAIPLPGFEKGKMLLYDSEDLIDALSEGYTSLITH